MKILLTGAHGFLGRHILQELTQHHVLSVGRHSTDHINADITRAIPLLPETQMVVHIAGKAHVIPKNKEESLAFDTVNFDGTRLLCEAITKSAQLPETFVFASTVAVYGLESGENINEDNPLNGNTPYAISKIKAEKYLEEWGRLNGINIVILRLPLVVGKDAPGNLGAMVRNIRRGTYARIGSGEARRSMVLASDIAKFIPLLSDKNGTYHLTDGIHPSFAMLEEHIAHIYGKKIHVIPPSMAAFIAKVGDYIPKSPFNSYRYSKMRQTLTFSQQKAEQMLGWKPVPVIDGFHP